MALAAVSGSIVMFGSSLLSQESLTKDGTWTKFGQARLKWEIIANAIAVALLCLSAWLANYHQLANGLLFLGVLAPLVTGIDVMVSGMVEICQAMPYAFRRWRRRKELVQNSDKPVPLPNPWVIKVISDREPMRTLSGLGQGEIHITLNADGIARAGILDINPAGHLAFGIDEKGPYFRCLSEKRPLLRREEVDPSYEHRNYLDFNWPFDCIIDFPGQPELFILEKLLGEEEGRFILCWNVHVAKRP